MWLHFLLQKHSPEGIAQAQPLILNTAGTGEWQWIVVASMPEAQIA